MNETERRLEEVESRVKQLVARSASSLATPPNVFDRFTVEQLPIGGGATEVRPSSFAWRRIGVDGEGNPQVKILKGHVWHMGEPLLASDTNVPIAGTSESSPTYVYAKVSKGSPGTPVIEGAAVKPGASDSYWYFLLYSFYLDSNGVVVFGFDWRPDYRLDAPIKK